MTKIILTYELLEQKGSKTHIANHIGVSRRTVIRWAQGIERHGSLDNFLAEYQQAKNRYLAESCENVRDWRMISGRR